MNKNLQHAFLACSLIASLSSVQADEFLSSKYDIYRGDVNGDGYQDIYLYRKDDIVIIASKPIIPLAIGVDASYLMTGSSGGLYGAPVLNNGVDVSTLVEQSSGVSFGYFDGDGLDDVIIQALGVGEQSLLLTGSSQGTSPAILQQFSEIAGQDTSVASGTISLEDSNGDGYTDFVVAWSGGGTYTFVNAGTGQFAFNGGPNQPPSIQVASAPAVDSESDEVGVVAGSFRVDESGSATYSVPVLTAPGIAGVAPQVSLNYSSQGGNGIVGQGWTLGGLSAISRCRQTQETEGATFPIKLNANDRFCLDGQKLIEVSGGTNPEYRTEIDLFAKIVGYSAAGGDPTYFRVWRKDGSVSEYGNTSDSRLEAPGSGGKGFAWAQNQFADSAGNAINFTYLELANGEHLVDEISYAGGDAVVEFDYETRTDKRFSYVAGSKFESNQRLKSITSRNDGLELRTYTLQYQYGASNGMSQVTSVSECNGATCYPATDFTWSNPANGVGGR